MIFKPTAHSDREPGPVQELADHLRSLKKRHILKRIIFIFTVALMSDIFYDLSATIIYQFWDIRISVPFFFETLFLILLARDIPRWRTMALASDLDVRFSLKDRLYSYVWYSRKKSIPEGIRIAQARESLSNIDFPALARHTRVRFPFLLVPAVLFSGTMLYLSWNTDYRPPGITNRVVVRNFLPEQPGNSPVTYQNQAGPGSGPDPDNAIPEPRIPSKTEDSQPPDTPDDSGTDTVSQVAASDPQEAEATSVPGGEQSSGGPFPGIGDSGDPQDPTEAPDQIRSFPVSQSASEPVPPSLKNSASEAFRDFPEATEFLSLVPGQGTQSRAPLDEATISNFEDDIERFPGYYKDHLQTYYWELKKWDKNP